MHNKDSEEKTLLVVHCEEPPKCLQRDDKNFPFVRCYRNDVLSRYTTPDVLHCFSAEHWNRKQQWLRRMRARESSARSGTTKIDLLWQITLVRINTVPCPSTSTRGNRRDSCTVASEIQNVACSPTEMIQGSNSSSRQSQDKSLLRLFITPYSLAKKAKPE